MSPIARYSDFGRRQLEGERVEIKALFDKEITIKAFVKMEGEYGKPFLIVQAELEGKLITFPCGSVACEQILEAQDKLPFIAKLTCPKGKKYYLLA